MSGFTKGGWQTVFFKGMSRQELYVKVSGGACICKILESPEEKANARLIAAAPKMHTLLDAINNDTGDWLSEEFDMPADDLIQAIHNRIGELFASITKVEKGA